MLTKAQHEDVLKEIETWMNKGNSSTEEEDFYFNKLVDQVVAYEELHFPIGYNLFIDDEREPSFIGVDNLEYWKIARTSEEAIKIIQDHGLPQFISFDHDLGGHDTAMVVCKFLANELQCPEFKFAVHSQNPIGKANIESYLNSYFKSIK